MQAVRTEEYEREETVSFRVISDLQTVGINVSEIKKLQEAGLNTILFDPLLRNIDQQQKRIRRKPEPIICCSAEVFDGGRYGEYR